MSDEASTGHVRRVAVVVISLAALLAVAAGLRAAGRAPAVPPEEPPTAAAPSAAPEGTMFVTFQSRAHLLRDQEAAHRRSRGAFCMGANHSYDRFAVFLTEPVDGHLSEPHWATRLGTPERMMVGEIGHETCSLKVRFLAVADASSYQVSAEIGGEMLRWGPFSMTEMQQNDWALTLPLAAAKSYRPGEPNWVG